MARVLLTGVLILVLAAGCSDSPPASSAPPGGGGDAITGRERIGWNQPAVGASDLGTLRYAIYVDGARRVLEGETCGASPAGDGFPCSAPLPPLTPGRHTLELAAFTTIDGVVVEGARSAPLLVTVAAATASVDTPVGGPLVSSDGLRLEAAILAPDLLDPVDLAVGPEHQVFVAERGGRIRIFHAAGEQSADEALQLFRQTGDAELLSIAVAPTFEATRHLHIGMAARGSEHDELHLARMRVTDGLLAEGAVLGSHRVPRGATALLRFGPDGHLYVGVGSGSEPDEAQNLTAAGGKILRLREDGFTPADNPGASPVWSLGHRDPRGFAWDTDRTFWEVERDDRGDEINIVRPAANYGWPVIRARQARPGMVRPVMILPAETEPAGIAVVENPSSPLFGSLIVSAEGGRDLLRLQMDTRRHQATSRLLLGRFGRIGQVAAGADGALYLLTANTVVGNAGHDMLIRVIPAPAVRGSTRRP